MQSLLIKELLNLFFHKCGNSPETFVSHFDNSNFLIGYNYRYQDNRFTNVSDSFKSILGYNQKNILCNGNFISKIIHPQDRGLLEECLKKPYKSGANSISGSEEEQLKQVKCRAKHITGYWKYLIIYLIDYWDNENGSNNKIGLIANERIRYYRKYNTGNPTKSETQPFKLINKDSNTISEMISPRETQILELISRGFVSKDIAIQLHICNSTVLTHRKNILSKLKVRNTAELIKIAAKQMLI